MNNNIRLFAVSMVAVFLLALCLPAASMALGQPVSGTGDAKEYHVLVIHPFTYDDPAHLNYNAGLIDVLHENEQHAFNYSFEYFDYARHSNDPLFFGNMADYLTIKYRLHPPDFIVTEFNMLPLLDRYVKEVFGDVPVIVTWRGQPPRQTDFPPNYLFVLYPPYVEENIALILKAKPDVERIYVVLGDSADERRIAERLRLIERDYRETVEFVWTNHLPYADMLDVVRQADERSAILYFHWFADLEGNRFEPAKVLEAILAGSSAPIFSAAEQDLGNGVVGGFMRDFEQSGRIGARAILDWLHGTTPPDRIYVDPSVYMFDWRQLDRWGIDEEALPEGSRIEYREVGVWEQYGGYIIGGLVLIALETSLIIALLINRSRRLKAERELIEANKMKDEFLINTSHELQTPLNGIINISEFLLDGKFGPVNVRQEKELGVVLSVARRLSSLIKDIIDLEKIKRNELRIQLVPTDAKSAAYVVLDVIRHLNDGSGVDIEMDMPDRLPPVMADEDRLIQVLFNLLGNAVKFTERGRVILSAREADGELRFTVEDTGIGMAPDQQEKLFRAFSQCGMENAEHYGGSGLGLFISRHLLERMNGKLWLEWSEPGRGSRFSFTLPIADEEASLQAAASDAAGKETVLTAEAAETQPSTGFTLLAVDDDPTNLHVLKLLLEGDGHEVLTASDGLEAIRMVDERKDIDLVLMDVMMPRMTGFEACREIRKKHSIHALPILMLSVRNSPEDLAAGYASGANDFVVKPFIAKELRARVNTFLHMKKSVQDALKNEMAFLRAQIKPHFLFNSLNTISYFIVRDGQKAKELLNRFAGYLRSSIDFKNMEAYIPLRKELEFVDAYLDIEKARFGDRLKTVISVQEEALNSPIPPLILQPIVENAVLHGIMKKVEGGTVELSVTLDGNALAFTIRDDGVGMNEAQLGKLFADRGGKEEERSVGLRNIHSRLEKLYGSGLRVHSAEGTGTIVTFTIPA